jgi:hypothetical protein
MELRTHSRSPYMEFAKLRSGARFNLATSGMLNYPLAELPVRLEDLEINGATIYGYAPLQERLAKLNGVAPECIVAAAGTSMANHLALAATLEPGDEVLIEHPTYELLASAAHYLGADVRYFKRRFEDGFSIDPAEVQRQITERTRLIALTNLHNPSGAFVHSDTLREVGLIAARHNARVLVDEVYLEALYEKRPPNAFHLGDHFLVTSSLTKAFGLSGLRCGWVVANPELCERMWRINDLYGATPAHPAELLSVIALDHLQKIGARAKGILRENRRSIKEFLDSRADLTCSYPEYGTIVFPKLLSGEAHDFLKLLREKYDTSVVPGDFFDMPRHFRVGMAGDPEMTREGIKRLSLALDEFSHATH